MITLCELVNCQSSSFSAKMAVTHKELIAHIAPPVKRHFCGRSCRCPHLQVGSIRSSLDTGGCVGGNEEWHTGDDSFEGRANMCGRDALQHKNLHFLSMTGSSCNPPDDTNRINNEAFYECQRKGTFFTTWSPLAVVPVVAPPPPTAFLDLLPTLDQ